MVVVVVMCCGGGLSGRERLRTGCDVAMADCPVVRAANEASFFEPEPQHETHETRRKADMRMEGAD